MQKDDILFALYKDKATNGSEDFQKQLKKYKNEVNLRNLYTRIVNYQIDKYGKTLDDRNESLSYIADMILSGKGKRNQKCREYRKGNRA